MAETEIKSINGKTLADITARENKLDKNQGVGNAGKILGIGADGIVVPQDKPTYTLPQATADALGGIKADAATAEDTQVVRIGTDGKLRTKPTGGSSITVDSELSSTSVNPVQNNVVTAALAEKITAPTTAAVGQIVKVKSVDGTGKPTEWEAADLPGGGDNETNFRLVFNQECLLDADMSVYEVDIDFGLQDFKEFIALIEYSASTNDVYQDEISFDGVTIEVFGGVTIKGDNMRRVIYAKRVTQTEYLGIHRAGTRYFNWNGGETASTLSYFSERIKTPTGNLRIWRNKSTEATTIKIKLYKR